MKGTIEKEENVVNIMDHAPKIQKQIGKKFLKRKTIREIEGLQDIYVISTPSASAHSMILPVQETDSERARKEEVDNVLEDI